MTTGELLLRLAQALAWPAVVVVVAVIVRRSLPSDRDRDR